ncbi:MAG TPA: hypothetical protein VNO82_08030 [Solirubrobacteraceae bacterium]|nr:hypothetical protein [Solirubrobacteraceae bacterium]
MTFSFGDPSAGLYGLARLGLAGGGDASALAVLFSGRKPVAAIARGEIEVAPGAGFGDLALPGLRATIEEPLQQWTVRFDDEAQGFELTFQAAGPPAEVEPSEPAARAGGMAGYVQLCHVHGTVRADGRPVELRGLGQRAHEWGEPDWERIGAARTVAAWLDDGTGVAVLSVRPAGAASHDEDAIWASLLGAAGSLRVDETRVSTTYDDEGRQLRTSLELWVGDADGYPRRAAGEVVCGSTLDLGQLRLDCAFLRWRMDGRDGVGRYDVLRRA